MKKNLIIAVAVLALVCTPVFASRQTYTYSSEEVQSLLILAKMTGTALPSMTYPVTGSDMLQMIEAIDDSKLSGPAEEMYIRLKSSLDQSDYIIKGRDGVSGIKLDMSVLGAEIWKGETVSEFKDRLPVARVESVLVFSDVFAGDFRFDFGANNTTATTIGDSVSVDSVIHLGDTAHDLVSKAYGSVGYKGVSLVVGRDRLSAGIGKTGNLELGENQLYQDFAKLSALSYPFSYDFTMSVYDSYPDDYDWNSSNPMVNHFSLSGPVKAVYIHRFSVSILNRASLSFYEGAMAYGDGILSDPRVLNPFVFIHNTFTYSTGSVNNFFGLEAELSLPSNLKLDLQTCLDQLKLSGESKDSGDNAFGVLANLSGSWVLGDGILNAYAEFVYNNRNLYLKEKYSLYPHDEEPLDQHMPFYMLDLVTDINHFYSTEYAYLGYKYGGDLISAGLGASYMWKGQTFFADFFFLSKGEFGIGKGEQRALRDPDYTETGIRTNTISLTIGADGTLYKGLDYKVRAGVMGKEFQFSVAFSVRPLEFFR